MVSLDAQKLNWETTNKIWSNTETYFSLSFINIPNAAHELLSQNRVSSITEMILQQIYYASRFVKYTDSTAKGDDKLPPLMHKN